MVPGLPRGFVRLPVLRRRRLDIFAGCPHPNFDLDGQCIDCRYSIWTPIRKQIRKLEETGKTLTEGERVDAVIAVITAPRSQPDGLLYQGILPRLPRHLRPARMGSMKRSRTIQQAIQTAQVTAERKRAAMKLIEDGIGLFTAMREDEGDLTLLKAEVNAFLDTYLSRFHFTLEESDLWLLILAYASRIEELDPEEIVSDYFLDTDMKRARFR
jgi:hypothetical protein